MDPNNQAETPHDQHSEAPIKPSQLVVPSTDNDSTVSSDAPKTVTSTSGTPLPPENQSPEQTPQGYNPSSLENDEQKAVMTPLDSKALVAEDHAKDSLLKKSMSLGSKPIFIIAFAVLLFGIGASFFLMTLDKNNTGSNNSSSGTSTSSENAAAYVMQKFLIAMENHDRKTADSLQSPALTTSIQKQAATPSFYELCSMVPPSKCLDFFNKQAILGAIKKTNIPYTSSYGTKGIGEAYLIKNSAVSVSGGGSSFVSLAVVPSSGTWLIDHADVEPLACPPFPANICQKSYWQ